MHAYVCACVRACVRTCVCVSHCLLEALLATYTDTSSVSVILLQVRYYNPMYISKLFWQYFSLWCDSRDGVSCAHQVDHTLAVCLCWTNPEDRDCVLPCSHPHQLIYFSVCSCIQCSSIETTCCLLSFLYMIAFAESTHVCTHDVPPLCMSPCRTGSCPVRNFTESVPVQVIVDGSPFPEESDVVFEYRCNPIILSVSPAITIPAYVHSAVD